MNTNVLKKDYISAKIENKYLLSIVKYANDL